MSSYMSAEENNIIVKTMMLQQSCNHVTGDDTNERGFKLIVDDPDDKECDCQLVRSIGGGRNTRVRLNNNMLMVDVLNIPTLSGGGLVTINFVIASVPRGMRIATLFWSEPIVIIDEHEEIISVARNSSSSFFNYVSDTNISSQSISAFVLRQNLSLFVVNPPLTVTFPPVGRVTEPQVVTSRYVIVQHTNLENLRNQRIFNGGSYMLAEFDCLTEAAERLLWKPNNIIFPANTIPTDVFDRRTVMTFDSETGRKSWVTDDEGSLPLRNFINKPFDITHTLSSGGLVTHSTINTFALIRWNERFPVMISHIPLSIRKT